MIKRDPKTGKLSTVPDVVIDIARARKECRDVIQGNVPFHTDTFSKPKPTPQPQLCECVPGVFLCDICRLTEGW